MRKLMLMLLLSGLLVLCGCDDRQEEIDALEVRLGEYAQYDELIGSIENDDYDNARAMVDAYEMQYRNEQVRGGEVLSVEINTDNWSDYFEIAELTQWRENDLGETTGFITHVCLVLREEYADRIITEESFVDFGWQALCSVKNCTVDLENRMISIENVFGSNAATFGDPEIIHGTLSFDERYLNENGLTGDCIVGKIGEIVVIGEYNLDGEMKPVCFDYENVTITQAQGRLMLTP